MPFRLDGCTPVKSVGHLAEAFGYHNTSCPSLVTRLNQSSCDSDTVVFCLVAVSVLDALASCCRLVASGFSEDDFGSWLIVPSLSQRWITTVIIRKGHALCHVSSEEGLTKADTVLPML